MNSDSLGISTLFHNGSLTLCSFFSVGSTKMLSAKPEQYKTKTELKSHRTNLKPGYRQTS